MILKKGTLGYCLLLSCIFIFSSCTSKQDNRLTDEAVANVSYPASPGFNKAASDSVAIVLADKVMKAMGGYENWKDTHFIAWTFLGRRHLIWDKHTGDVRINSLVQPLKIIVNIHSMEGKVMKNGKLVTNPDSLHKYLEMGREIWINDAYWLVMPYKMKDSGVTLTYLGEDTTQAGGAAQLVQLTFENVGVTPENKFHVWIGKKSNMVEQWAYFRYAKQDTPNFVMPWQNYQQHGEIMLSGDRGRMALTDIMVFKKLPNSIFESFEPVALQKLKKTEN